MVRKMTKLYCTKYKEAPCCTTCHADDTFFKTIHKGFEVNACCGSIQHICMDIDQHDEGKENDCV